jgi:hypothetical protein
MDDDDSGINRKIGVNALVLDKDQRKIYCRQKFKPDSNSEDVPLRFVTSRNFWNLSSQSSVPIPLLFAKYQCFNYSGHNCW